MKRHKIKGLPSKVAQAASLCVGEGDRLAAFPTFKVAQAASLCSEGDRQAACPTLGERQAASLCSGALPESGYLNPFATVDTHHRSLPHWRQEDVWYFVTYRLADSLPQSAITALTVEREHWLAAHPEPRSDKEMEEYWDRFGGRMHDLLDAVLANAGSGAEKSGMSLSKVCYMAKASATSLTPGW